MRKKVQGLNRRFPSIFRSDSTIFHILTVALFFAAVVSKNEKCEGWLYFLPSFSKVVIRLNRGYFTEDLVDGAAAASKGCDSTAIWQS